MHVHAGLNCDLVRHIIRDIVKIRFCGILNIKVMILFLYANKIRDPNDIKIKALVSFYLYV